MSILHVYPERDGDDFYLGFWLEVDDTEDETTRKNLRIDQASNDDVTDADARDLLLISAHGTQGDDNSGEIDLNGDSLTSDELAKIETTLVCFDSCGMGANRDYLQTFHDEGSTRYCLAPITSNDAGDSSTQTMVWFSRGCGSGRRRSFRGSRRASGCTRITRRNDSIRSWY